MSIFNTGVNSWSVLVVCLTLLIIVARVFFGKIWSIIDQAASKDDIKEMRKDVNTTIDKVDAKLDKHISDNNDRYKVIDDKITQILINWGDKIRKSR